MKTTEKMPPTVWVSADTQVEKIRENWKNPKRVISVERQIKAIFIVIVSTVAITITTGFTDENRMPTLQSKKMEKDTMNMVITRTFDASVELVWKAWSDEEAVKQWWGPRGFTAPVAKMDFRAGGKSLVCMRTPDGHNMFNTWTYQKIVAMNRLEFVQHFSDKDGHKLSPAKMNLPPGIPDEVRHVITFRPLQGDRTEITVTEFGYTSEQVVELSKAGMNECLDKMEESLKEKKVEKKPTNVSGYAPVNGLKMYYEIHGEGKPIVLLHGSYMSIDMNWGQLIPELSKTRKVIAIEMQGHGRTADADRPFSYPSFSKDVAGVLKHLKIESADIAGYSLGGTVAYQLAIQNPRLVEKLVIISAPYKLEGWQPEVLTAFKAMQPAFLDNTPLKTEYLRLAPDTANWSKLASKIITLHNTSYNLGEQNIKSIKAPTLLIMGDNDGIDKSILANTYQLLGGAVFGDMAGIPPSQLAILSGQTHVSLIMETATILSLVNSFLK